MKALIVDDEAPARLELLRLLELHPEVFPVGEAANVTTALELTALHHPDLVFLDIHLRGESGFDYLARLPDAPLSPRIIFVTAYDHYAIRAFECNALDYLLKPIEPERLAQSLRRVAPPRPPAAPVTENDVVFVKLGAATRFVPWVKIHAITANGNYTQVHLANGEQLMVLRSLKEWLLLAPPGRFIRVHRSTIVQLRAIREIENVGEKKRLITLLCKRQIVVGREYFASLNVSLGRSGGG